MRVIHAVPAIEEAKANLFVPRLCESLIGAGLFSRAALDWALMLAGGPT